MDKKLKSNSLSWVLLKMNILPIVLLAMVITIFSTTTFANSMHKEAKNGLVNVCNTIFIMYDNVYDGEFYALEQDGAIYMFKGEHQLNGDFSIIDAIKEQTDIDVTVFYKDTRVITTITNEDGSRAIGTRASAVVIREVFEGETGNFYPSAIVGEDKYFAYYEPLFDSDGTCIGMIFVGKPSVEVEQLVWKSIGPMILIAIITMLLAGIITVRFSNHFVEAIRKIESFLGKVSNGNLHAEVNSTVLKRTDELGEMGRYVVKMQKSLRELVEQDILTGLHNRRCGEKLLNQVQESYIKEGLSYCVAIGDIDHFKSVNDTYGHECGDVVLTKVSTQFRRMMKGKGFAARWGGEEFLLVFQGMHLEDAVKHLEELMDTIRSTAINYKEDNFEDISVHVTMTFGIVEGNEEKLEHIIRDADTKLYYGKNNGRNQIVQ